MVETTASNRTPTTPETPYLHAIVAAVAVTLFFFILSFYFVGIFREMLFITLFLLPVSLVVAVGVLAWYGGCRIAVLPAVLFLMTFSMLRFGFYITVSSRFYTSVPSVPVYITVFLIGYEWTFRARDRVFEFLRTFPGMLSAVLGVVHVVAGMAVQLSCAP